MGDTLGSRWVAERVRRIGSPTGSVGTLGTSMGLDDMSFSKTVELDLMTASVDLTIAVN